MSPPGPGRSPAALFSMCQPEGARAGGQVCAQPSCLSAAGRRLRYPRRPLLSPYRLATCRRDRDRRSPEPDTSNRTQPSAPQARRSTWAAQRRWKGSASRRKSHRMDRAARFPREMLRSHLVRIPAARLVRSQLRLRRCLRPGVRRCQCSCAEHVTCTRPRLAQRLHRTRSAKACRHRIRPIRR
jgi:hypothetical protein